MIEDIGPNKQTVESQSIARELLLFSISRDIKYLFKYLLGELDVLERNGTIDLDSKEFFRKRVLDRGNSCLRNLESGLDKFNIYFKETDN